MRRFLGVALLVLLVVVPAPAQEGLTEAKPADVGTSPGLLKDGLALYEKAVAEDELRGAVLLVARRGKVVLHEAIGWRDADKRLPMQKDTVFHVASNTKPVVAAAVLMLAEEGKLDLDAEVRRYLPSFDNEKSRAITVRHLLTHTSGLRIPGVFVSPLLAKSTEHPDAPSLRVEVDRFGAVGPEEKPGTTFSYSNPGYNTLAVLVEVAAQQPLEEFLAERVYRPLGMRDTVHRDRAGLVERRAWVCTRKDGAWQVTYRPGDAPQYPFVRGSGGMLTTAADYTRFLQLFLDGGTRGGRRLLKAETVREATAPQTRSVYPAEEQRRRPGFYGFGWQVSAEGVFSHAGSDGTFAWVDPADEVVGIVFTQCPGGKNPREQFVRLVRDAVAGRPKEAQGGRPRLVGHRGLLLQAPENTLAGFAACLELRVGFELDVRRTKDGRLICLHDEDVARTTGGVGKVADLTLAELRKLDVGARFDPAFTGERVPTLGEVFALLRGRRADQVLVALDLKVGGEGLEADVVKLAQDHDVLGQVVCIGRAISEPAVRKLLRAADAKAPAAALAQTADDLAAALADPDSDWVYVRFVPTPAQVAQVHKAGKRVFLVGPAVAGREPENWLLAREAGVDALLTDHPLECRAAWRSPREGQKNSGLLP